MSRLIAVLTLLYVGLPSCMSPAATPAEIEAATLYFPPTVKIVDEPRFSFSSAERQKALETYREVGADTLFEFVIDDEGQVVRSRLVRTNVKRVYRESLEDHAERLVFSGDGGSGRYRAFYFPTDYDMNPTFEWL